MPWLRRNGHLIDWANCCFLPSVAALSKALLSPPKPSALDSLRREACYLGYSIHIGKGHSVTY
ncbi:uncharacterized protein VP01_8g7 [Puccinia sorghi]|uniref:Uncharacterized protein n=1 Tax=Puccinia sorghi TaxID=27349 RepID=A0A0L6U8G5_9BASI|nr:uncharacterized protein VP01_8g7 [Puccinia sorghi]